MFQDPELNIADELYDLLLTDKDCTPISSVYIWRKFRRDSKDVRVSCKACNNNYNGYAEGAKDCPYCNGYGYTYDDVIIEGYLSKGNLRRSFYNLSMDTTAGKSDRSKYELFTKKDILLQEEDKLIIPKYTQDGRIQLPFTIDEATTCLFSRPMVASRSNSDFNIALLEG